MTQVTDRLSPEQAAEIRNRADAILADGADPAAMVEAFQLCRRRADLTQAQVADAAGCSLTVIRNIESGRTRFAGEIREKMWRVVLAGLNEKHDREKAFYPRLEALARLNRTREELAAENTLLAQRINVLESRVARLGNQLAEHIDTIRPALEKLEREAVHEGSQTLQSQESN